MGEVVVEGDDKALFLAVGADVRASGAKAGEMEAFKFVLFGMHATEKGARLAVERHLDHAPWFAEAVETWSGVLRPFRHFGGANFLDRAQPGPCYECDAAKPQDSQPLVIMTSVGWEIHEGMDWDRIKRFSDGVAAVRIGMTAVPGLHSQQSFSFPGMLEIDGVTVTFWKDLASAMGFAYGPGLHRSKVKHQRETPDGDRTSFTRFTVVESRGTWHGVDPLQ